MLIFILLLGSFLVNPLPTLVVFDSGASRLFGSSTFSRSFGIPLDALEHPMWISVAGRDRVPVLSVFHDCTLEIFGVSCLIDLVPIPMGGVSVIVGMKLVEAVWGSD